MEKKIREIICSQCECSPEECGDIGCLKEVAGAVSEIMKIVEDSFNIRVTEWQNEDETTEDSFYDTLFPLSKVDIVRMFPKKIEVINSL